MTIINGDILEIKKGIIVHQVNCQYKMGAGLAAQIRKKYPNHYNDFINTKPELGNIVITKINKNLFIVGIYGQYYYGKIGTYTDYLALKKGFERVRYLMNKTNLDVFIPYKIGCGLAGGTWDVVKQIIENTIPNCYIVKFK